MKYPRLLALAFLLTTPAAAQWQVPDHAVPIGRGAGATGFKTAAPGTAGQALISTGATTDPVFGLATALGTITTGTWQATVIGPQFGGTGLGTYAVGDLLYASGTTTLARLADIATGNVLRSGGVGVAPAWGKVALATDVSGQLPIANNCPGATGASGTTYLRGDCTWATPAGGGNVSGPGSAVDGNAAVFNGTSGTVIKDGGPPVIGGANRQSILSSNVDSTGFPNFASSGTGLNVNLQATTPFTLTFAAGFSAISGPVDKVGQIASNQTSYWASLPANQYSFLAVDRNTGTGALTASQTLMRPQRAAAFYAPRQALLHLDSNTTDDWNNPWTAVGAGTSYTAGCAKFGSVGLNLTGGSSYVQSTSIFNPGQSNWTMDVWTKLTSNASQSIFSVGNLFGAYIATNGSGKLTLFLSSGGASWDIANGTAGATTVSTGAFHHVALVYNGAAYVVYLDGVAEISVTSAMVVWPDGNAMGIGTQVGTGTGATNNSCFDEFDFVPYARWVTTFTPPVAAYVIAGDWFDTSAMVMKTATAAGPTWTTIQRLYVAEVITGSSFVSAIYNYSPPAVAKGSDFSIISFGKLRVGNKVVYAQGTPQFMGSSTPGTACVTVKECTINSPVTWLLNGPTSLLSPAQQVPPDALWFDVQINVGHGPISAANYQDCTFQSRLPIGTNQNYVAMWAAYGLYSGMGTAVPATAFIEGAGPVVRFPVINGVAAFQTIINGPTCTEGGTNNQARIVAGILIGYEMP